MTCIGFQVVCELMFVSVGSKTHKPEPTIIFTFLYMNIHQRPKYFQLVGRGRVLKEGSRVALLGYGTIVQSCLAASQLLHELGISVTVADARFCKPLDGNLIKQLANEHEVLITVEEGSIGGFSSHVSHFLALNGLLDGNLKVFFIYLLIFS